MQNTFSTLFQLPLYTYLPSRGIRDCLLFVAAHCRQVRDLCQNYRSRPDALGLQGGLQISLDMEKAFDTVDRKLVLSFFALDSDLLKLVQFWLAPHKYCIPFKQLIGQVTAWY